MEARGSPFDRVRWLGSPLEYDRRADAGFLGGTVLVEDDGTFFGCCVSRDLLLASVGMVEYLWKLVCDKRRPAVVVCMIPRGMMKPSGRSQTVSPVFV